MTKYTSLETSKKLYEAFPDWGKPKDQTEMHWFFEMDHPTQFVYDNYCWLEHEDEDYICPAYDTDYLLEKLQEWFSGTGGSDFGRMEIRFLADAYAVSCRSWDDDVSLNFSDKNAAEALADLALELKKEGIL